MLKVPQKVDLALVLMRRLAEGQSDARPLSLDDVARDADVSQGYLEEIARLLRAAGLVTGRRGVRGGYVLARPAADISVADVVVALLGNTWTAECLGEKPRGANAATEETAVLWRKVQGQVMTTLRAVTVAELVKTTVETRADARS